jgi:enoyl-CoA hydratase
MIQTNFEHLLFEVDEAGIATITVNRETKLNALNFQVLNELEEAFMAVRQKADVKGALLKGAGTKAFVAGADIAELSDLNEFRGAAASERGQEIFSYIESTPKPVIAVIEGYCLGGGCELAMACHLRVAAQNAVFGLPEVTLGLIPGYGGTQRLSRLVGRSRAMEMILTGNHYKADIAVAFGLVNSMSATGEAYNDARKMMMTILSRAPKAVSAAIKAIKASETGVREGLTAEADLFGQLCGSQDFREGINAFIEKRRPVFTGS